MVNEKNENVEMAMKKLAMARIDENMYIEYMCFSRKMLNLYDEYLFAIEKGNNEEVIQKANWIISSIKLKFSEGLLK